MKSPVALVILDGWGVAPAGPGNAVSQAATPHLDRLFATCPHTTLGAAGEDVGLPDGQMGNSEVGHLNIGAGRIVYQDLTRISKSIRDGSLFTNPVLVEACTRVANGKGKLHLLGLLSDGGVHSHNFHLYALVELAQRLQVQDICIHPFLDGRDTPPRSAATYLQELEQELQRRGAGVVASVIGRYYAMDRDNRWERVARAYDALTRGTGLVVQSIAEAIASAYAADQSDEFVEPRVICRDGRPIATIDNGDVVIFFNFRSDRAREITRALALADFDGFVREKVPQLAGYVCLTEYDETFNLPVAFPPVTTPNLLGEVVAAAGKTQLRIAETEKYAHVTFFFNGGSETSLPGEDRVLVPSPKDVATYDLKPAMSAVAVTDEVVQRIASRAYDLIVLNFANPDMVGHTGILPAAVAAMETVDSCVGRIVAALRESGGSLLLTADHGNCERMFDDQGGAHTAHTTNPVPLLLMETQARQRSLRSGILADIAPTLLELLHLPQPAEMSGRSLLIG